MVSLANRKQETRPLLSKEQVFSIGSNNGDSLFITKKRLEALAVYNRLQIPQKVRHLWKYSKPAVFIPNAWDWEFNRGQEFLSSTEYGEINEARLLPGQDLFITLNDDALDQGIEIGPLNDQSSISNLLGKVVTPEHGFFEAMNTALWSSGVCVRVPANVHLEDPIRLNIHTDARSPFVRIIIYLEEGASAGVFENYMSSAQTGPTVVVSEVVLEAGARLNHGIVFAQSSSDGLHYTHRSVVGKDGDYTLASASIGEGDFKGDVGSLLNAPGAQSRIRSFAFSSGGQQNDLHTSHRHRNHHTYSDLVFRSVVTDSARSVNTGLIRIDETAIGSEAFQEARNLLLSSSARAETIPELEILTNDVICSHGAATGTIDTDQLFYLMSRGLNEDLATRLIVDGFYKETIDLLPKAWSGLMSHALSDTFNERFGVS